MIEVGDKVRLADSYILRVLGHNRLRLPRDEGVVRRVENGRADVEIKGQLYRCIRLENIITDR